MAEKKSGEKKKLDKQFIIAGISGVCSIFSMAVHVLGRWNGWRKRRFMSPKPRKKESQTLLYKCPACKREAQMAASGTRLWCGACGRQWLLEPNGKIRARKGKTEFRTVEKWSEWERECVRSEIQNGTYHFEDIVRVETVNDCGQVLRQGSGHLYQTLSGTRLECRYYGEDYTLIRRARGMEDLKIEYDPEGTGDCIELPIRDDRFRCYLSKKNVVTKLAFATEEIHRNAKQVC